MKNKVTKKIYETPVADRKIKELEPKSIKSKLKGRNINTILHYNSMSKDIIFDKTPDVFGSYSPLSKQNQ